MNVSVEQEERRLGSLKDQLTSLHDMKYKQKMTHTNTYTYVHTDTHTYTHHIGLVCALMEWS